MFSDFAPEYKTAYDAYREQVTVSLGEAAASFLDTLSLQIEHVAVTDPHATEPDYAQSVVDLLG